MKKIESMFLAILFNKKVLNNIALFALTVIICAEYLIFFAVAPKNFWGIVFIFIILITFYFCFYFQVKHSSETTEKTMELTTKGVIIFIITIINGSLAAIVLTKTFSPEAFFPKITLSIGVVITIIIMMVIGINSSRYFREYEYEDEDEREFSTNGDQY